MTGVDHLIYGVPDLEAGVEELQEILGVRAIPGGQHPGFGTRNALIALGPETYLEMIGPDPDQPAPGRPRVFGLDGLTRPRIVTWAARESDLKMRVESAMEQGIRLGDILSGSRRTPDGDLLSWRFTDPYIFLEDGIVPFFIDWGATANPARAAARGCTLRNLRAEHPNPTGARAILKSLGLDLPVQSGPAPALIATISTPKGTVELR